MTECKLSLVLPCWSRPELTRRAVASVLEQARTFAGAEIFFVGDACPHWQAVVDSDWFAAERERVRERMEFVTWNQPARDGTPAAIINEALARARGEYFCWLGNDDRLLPGHFENYHGFCQANQLDLGYFDSELEDGTARGFRCASLSYGHVGHSEICVRTEFARQTPAHGRGYGHDWEFILACIKAPGARVQKGPARKATYVVNVSRKKEHVYQNGTG